MAVPKRHRSKSRQRQRRMHLYLRQPEPVRCAKCSKEVLAHAMCANCGYYRGREVVDIFAELDKKERKRREKEIAVKEKEQ